MAKKSAFDRVSNAAVNIKKIADIIKAFMQGGWGAAALQALKHYWPQITVIAIVLTLIPIIIITCLPMMMFGYDTSSDPEISSMTQQAELLNSYYGQYDTYCAERVSHIKETVLNGNDSQGSNTENSDNAADTDSTATALYEVQLEGQKIQKNTFIAIHCVSVGNDLNSVTEEGIKAMVNASIVYSIDSTNQNTETSSNDSTVAEPGSTDEDNSNTEILIIRYLTAEELMSHYNFSDMDREWMASLLTTLETPTNQ